jgi:hypothetical protein
LIYGLVGFKNKNDSKGIIAETEANSYTKEIKEFNHSYFQGLLLTIGNLKGLKTFVPNQDKNRLFLNTKLADIRTLNNLPFYYYLKQFKGVQLFALFGLTKEKYIIHFLKLRSPQIFKILC